MPEFEHTLNDELDRFTKAVISNDKKAIQELAEKWIDGRDTALVKCHTCNEVIGLVTLRNLVMVDADSPLSLAVSEHMVSCPGHDVRVPLPTMKLPDMLSKHLPQDYAISHKIEESLKDWCNRNQVPDYSSWLSSIYVPEKRLRLESRYATEQALNDDLGELIG